MTRPRIAVIGGGPAGLMAAEALATGGATVTLFDRMPSVGRKFLLAGRGGLNLTHSEALDAFLRRYGAAEPRLCAAVAAFPPAALRDWAETLGQPTFVGSSGRVFPHAFKTSPLLRAWLGRLQALGVVLRTRHCWTGWDREGRLRFVGPDGAPLTIEADAAVLALGGASWPRLGSDGGWVAALSEAGIAVAPLQAANCGVLVGWSDHFASRFAGTPLKRLALSFAGRRARGEAIVTRTGLEGGAVYGLSAALRDAIASTGEARLTVDLRPDVTVELLAERLGKVRGNQSLSNFLRKAVALPPVAIALLRETSEGGERLADMPPSALAERLKSVPIRATGVAPLARAISTAGGVRFDELDAHFMLRRRPGVFIAGEMLDWEAPTGGYLLQACLATGRAAAEGALAFGCRFRDRGAEASSAVR